MNERQYVDAAARKIKCDRNKKKEIKKQLLTDIRMRTEQGERLEDILSQMGTPKEIADGFNETISVEEKKRYTRNKVLMVAVPVVGVLLCLILAVYWIFPKSVDISQSKYFDREQVEAAMKETVELLDEGDYDALQENAIPQMQAVLNAEEMEDAKSLLSDDWGERKLFGAVYMVELIQGNRHYAVGEMTVTYENVSTTYHLTYDQDMRLAGIYMR